MKTSLSLIYLSPSPYHWLAATLVDIKKWFSSVLSLFRAPQTWLKLNIMIGTSEIILGNT